MEDMSRDMKSENKNENLPRKLRKTATREKHKEKANSHQENKIFLSICNKFHDIFFLIQEHINIFLKFYSI